MKSIILFAAAAIILASPSIVSAKNGNAPGQMMRQNGPVAGSPGASGYAPGQLKRKKKAAKHYRGGAKYAPRRETTGSGTWINGDGRTRYDRSYR